MRRRLIIGGALLALGIGVAVFRVPLRELLKAWQRPELPSATERAAVAVNASNSSTATPPSTENANRALPLEINLKVPFTSQAPHANWDEEHNEFCEEAAVLMAGRYFTDRDITGKDDAESALQQLKARELELFGYYKDTTANETAQLLEDRYPVTTQLLTEPTVDQIKAALADGALVLVPAAGRQLKNPNFKRPGPLYHMLVLKGYTQDGQFITNDPGTRKGADYVYPFERVMTAMHDWNGGDVANGAKVVVQVWGR